MKTNINGVTHAVAWNDKKAIPYFLSDYMAERESEMVLKKAMDKGIADEILAEIAWDRPNYKIDKDGIDSELAIKDMFNNPPGIATASAVADKVIFAANNNPDKSIRVNASRPERGEEILRAAGYSENEVKSVRESNATVLSMFGVVHEHEKVFGNEGMDVISRLALYRREKGGTVNSINHEEAFFIGANLKRSDFGLEAHGLAAANQKLNRVPALREMKIGLNALIDKDFPSPVVASAKASVLPAQSAYVAAERVNTGMEGIRRTSPDQKTEKDPINLNLDTSAITQMMATEGLKTNPSAMDRIMDKLADAINKIKPSNWRRDKDSENEDQFSR